MYKLSIAIFLSVICITFANEKTTSEEIEIKNFYEKCLCPTVKLTYKQKNEEKKEGVASGFVVRSEKSGDKYRNIVVTAAHIVESLNGDLNISVPRFDKKLRLDKFDKFVGQIFAKNSTQDLAIVIFESPFKCYEAMFDFDVDLFVSSKIFKVGYGLGDDIRYESGEMNSTFIREPKVFEGMYRFSSYTIFGDSGGPVFNKKNNKVIGVTIAIRSMENQLLTHHAYACPIFKIKEWDQKTNGNIGFCYDRNKKIPALPFVQLMWREYIITE